ncbi:MAG: ABC transporter ATP-binding protein [Bacteroidota bacterium]
MKPILEIQHVIKEFFIGGVQEPYLSLRDVLSNPFKKFRQPAPQKFRALDDVSFEVMPGESIGIIGRNGAGKSTLLKILSGITPPTSGKITCRGRVASLLEVGTGFHPELTGRENIYMNGSILGMRKWEIDKHMDEIIEFSGIEKFMNTPLKRYSSGMQLRLAFAVAAHLEPEILIIDEVLAVGDAEFQKKCLGKMNEVSQSGRTILFVSHDLSAVSTLTKKSIYLETGTVKCFDETNLVISQYTSVQNRSCIHEAEPLPGKPSVTKVELQTSENGAVHSFGHPLALKFEVNIPGSRKFENMALSVQVLNHLNYPVLYNWIFDIEQPVLRKEGINKLSLSYPALRLYKGNYFIRVHLAETKTKGKFQQFDCCPFEVVMLNRKEPEWGWQTNVCQYFDDAVWQTETGQTKIQDTKTT